MSIVWRKLIPNASNAEMITFTVKLWGYVNLSILSAKYSAKAIKDSVWNVSLDTFSMNSPIYALSCHINVSSLILQDASSVPKVTLCCRTTTVARKLISAIVKEFQWIINHALLAKRTIICTKDSASLYPTSARNSTLKL